MGKEDFPAIYSQACQELGFRPTIKVSYFSDTYDETKNYAGIIVYHKEGSYTWYNEQGVAKGYKGRAFYVILRCTEGWTAHEFKRAGRRSMMVHDYLFHLLSDGEFSDRKICCGGFAVMKGAVHYSSHCLNKQSSDVYSHRTWESDGSKLMSQSEKLLVDLTVDNWKERGCRGPVLEIPDDIDMHIKMMGMSSGLPVGSNPDTGSFDVGARVRIRLSVADPKHGWGPMQNKYSEIGVVTDLSSVDNTITVEFPSCSSWCADAAELEKVAFEFKEGMKVQLRRSVGEPKHGWGSLKRNEVGVVTSVSSTDSNPENSKVYINFPSQKGWTGRASEMQVIGFDS
uniref:Mind bomb SH3 repeat domain-containing protein n=1 Tax=Tetraselmis chuii TaxID=63592 RepID=A0A7S1X4V2_9CHLO|mmetsp:Transcript_29196/g.52198  ORF Transcript_29196/g.52198 Transcript_29196/m.52198 type:complete len:341 (+) Transcript_29196:456-1478(+)|eukprot:CAMPEP_0177769598 /NCGR_PEP_ID=MMETSP0491_2-20121128/10418_1 /TAXON_ID=63592 /ORGANISM="Tetraselmis chuii, Strain PLY429" /LENGTH=340 /DNA_ID=CAMNT_0019286639 /DNA_START=509 /DNA_END=1531 /DNA_ORIENTATION=+